MKKITLIFSSFLFLSLPVWLVQVNGYPVAKAATAVSPTPTPIAVPNPTPPPVNNFVLVKANLTSALTQSRSLVGYLTFDQQRNSLTTLTLNTELGFAKSIGYDLSTASSYLSGSASQTLINQINTAINIDKTITSLLNADQPHHGQPYHHDVTTEINTAKQLMNQILSALDSLSILSINPSPTPTPISTPLASPTPTKSPTATVTPVGARTPTPTTNKPTPATSKPTPTPSQPVQTDQQKLDYLRNNGPDGLQAIQKTIAVRQNTIVYINGLANISKDDRNAIDTQLNGEIQILNGLADKIRKDQTVADIQRDKEAYFYKWANPSDTATSLDQSYQLINIYAASSEISAIANFDSIFTGLQNVLNDLSKSYSKNDSAHLKIINDLENQLKSTKSLVDQQKKVATGVIDKLAYLYVKKSNHIFFSTYSYLPGGTFSGNVTIIINNEGNILKGINQQFSSSKGIIHNIVVQIEQQISLLFDGKTFASEVMNPSAIWYVAPKNEFALSFIKPTGYSYKEVLSNPSSSNNKSVSSCIFISTNTNQNYQCVPDGPPVVSNPKQYLIEIDKVLSPSDLGSTNGSKTIQIGYETGLILPDYNYSNSTNSDKVSKVVYTSSVNKESFIIKMMANSQVTNADWNLDKTALSDFLSNFIVVK